MNFKIITDTSSNLPLSWLEGEDISIVPFTYYFLDNTAEELYCINIEEFDGVNYYNSIQQGRLVNTSQVNPQRYYDAMAPAAAKGQDILYIAMSSGISGAYNSSLTAKAMIEEEYPNCNCYCLDTRAASLGEGLVVLKAIEYRQAGMSLHDCYEKLKSLCDNIYQVFTVDNLKHLQRTGRLSNAAAIIGTMLNIKPLLRGNEKGQIINFAKVRGNKKALMAMADKYDQLVKDASQQTVFIAHSNNPEDTEFLCELLKRNNPPKEIRTVVYEPVTGAHVGPGTVALFFTGDKDVRYKD